MPARKVNAVVAVNLSGHSKVACNMYLHFCSFIYRCFSTPTAVPGGGGSHFDFDFNLPDYDYFLPSFHFWIRWPHCRLSTFSPRSTRSDSTISCSA